MANNVYAYDDLETLKQSILSIKKFLSFTQGGGGGLGNDGLTLYAKVTEVVSDTEVKGLQVVWDSSLDPRDYAAPEGTAIIWDSDEFPSTSQNYIEPSIFTDTVLTVDQVIEVIFYIDKSGTTRWKARIGGGGSALVYIEITASTNISTYTGTIFDNPIDRTSVEIGVTVRSLKQSDGTIPDSAAGQGEWCIFVDDVYHIVNPSVAYGT